LLVLSAIAFSTAGFFTRQAPVDLWAMVFWRNLFGAAALLFVILATSRGSLRGQLRFGLKQAAVIGFGALGTITYLAAFKFTSVANISIIYATAPLLTAAAAWLWLREGMARKTLFAAVMAVLGVGLTVAHSLGAGTLLGDALALAMTLSLSLMAVAARGNTLPAAVTALAASLAATITVLPVGWLASASFAIGWQDGFWLAAFGIVTMAIALPSYLAGAAEVAAGRSMLISALEMPLAPLWVWLAFGETPALATILGGSIVALAILYELNTADRPRLCAEACDDSAVGKAIRRAVQESRYPGSASMDL
jgi:drug/metabolite transporter (DMT)-like permease